MRALPVDRDAVAEPDRLLDVVRDEQRPSCGPAAWRLQELVLQPLAHHRVDRAERLVHQQHRRVGGQRPGHARPAGAGRRRAGRGSGRRTSAGSSPTRSSSSAARSRALRALPAQQAAGRSRCSPAPSCAGRARPAGSRSRSGGAARPGRRSEMSSPSRKIRPSVGSMSRLTIFIVVVLPQPDGPTSVTSSPSATSKDRSSTAVVPSGYRLVTCSNRIMGPHCWWVRPYLALRCEGHVAGMWTVRPDCQWLGDRALRDRIRHGTGRTGRWAKWPVRTAWRRTTGSAGSIVRSRAQELDRRDGPARVDHRGVGGHRAAGGVSAGAGSPAAGSRVAGPVLGFTTVLYTVPSLAMFSLLLPVFGLSAARGRHRPGALLADHPGP